MTRPGVLSVIRNTRGNVATVVALLAIPLIAAATGAIELMDMSNSRQNLQEAVDTGALSGAVQLGVANLTSNNSTAIEAAITSAQNAMAGKNGQANTTFTATVDTQKGAVTVNGLMERKSLIGFMGFGDAKISVTATADGLQKLPLCILQTGTGGGIDLSNNSIIRAIGCAVHANQNIDVQTGALVQAAAVQATGTVKGMTQPTGNSGALPITDPFATLNLKSPLPCLSLPVKIVLTIETVTYPPGVHCDMIQVTGSATVKLLPGEHYFMQPLQLSNNSTLVGDDVVLIFDTGESFDFGDRASIRISARKSGRFAGFLIATSRDNTHTFKIASDNVSQLLGTIYIPSANLEISSQGNVAQDSAWSVIVAKQITLTNNPVLVINHNYVGSGVPVPDGVGPSNSKPSLVK